MTTKGSILTSEDLIADALADGHISFREVRGITRIVYHPSGHAERWSDPEEKVRAGLFAELIYRYEYAPERIGFEVVVPRRTASDKADLVVYRDDEQKDPFIVIECKPGGVTDKVFDQAVEQACGNRSNLGAPYAAAVAGLTRRILDFTSAKVLERNRNRIADLPKRYGKAPDWRYLRGVAGSDIAPVSRDALRTVIGKCHQTLWEGGKRSPIEAFDEFCKIVFIKVQDEKRHAKVGEPYSFQRKTDETNDQLRSRLVALYASEQRRDPEVFEDSLKVAAAPLATLVEHIEAISLSKTDLDTKGMAFEAFMGGFFKGDFGQYFTPRDLINFCVEALEPGTDDRVLDPACGSGGFLLHALDLVRTQANDMYPDHNVDPEQFNAHYRMWHDFAQNNLFGIEINEQLARVAKMNMIIHDDGHTNVVGHDALDFMRKLSAERKGLTAGSFDVVLSNPPFGATVKSSEKGDDFLDQYDLRAAVGAPRRSVSSKKNPARGDVKTEILFLERIHQFLKPGSGRAAIILPEGILNNGSLKPVREWMLKHFQVMAVVSLPEHAFSHYNANVKTSIIFVRRLGEDESAASLSDAAVLMASVQSVGYDAAGRTLYDVEIDEASSSERTETRRTDLLSTRVHLVARATVGGKGQWEEQGRRVVPDSGLLAVWRYFQRAVALHSDELLPAGTDPETTYIARHGDLSVRMDVQYNHPQHLAMIDDLTRRGATTLDKLVNFSDERWNPKKADGDSFRYIEIGGVDRRWGRARASVKAVADAPSRARMLVRDGDLLVSLTRPDRGAIVLLDSTFDGAVATTGFSVLRDVDETQVHPEYLWYALRSETSRRQMYYRQSGGNYPAITEDELGRILIVLPSLEEQGRVLEGRRVQVEQIEQLLDQVAVLEAELFQGLNAEVTGLSEDGELEV